MPKTTKRTYYSDWPVHFPPRIAKAKPRGTRRGLIFADPVELPDEFVEKYEALRKQIWPMLARLDKAFHEQG